jgi:hypothetical protein
MELGLRLPAEAEGFWCLEPPKLFSLAPNSGSPDGKSLYVISDLAGVAIDPARRLIRPRFPGVPPRSIPAIPLLVPFWRDFSCAKHGVLSIRAAT